MRIPLPAIVMLLLPAFAAAAPPAPIALQVRVTEMTALGPDGNRHTLYRNRQGLVTTYRDAAHVRYQVEAGSLPEGGYRDLRVKMKGRAVAIYADGRTAPCSLRALGKPSRKALAGQLWIEAGNVTAWRPRAGQAHGRHHDDD